MKYVEKLLLFACLVISRTLCQTVFKFQASSFDELSFFPRAGLLCLVKCDEGRLFRFCVYKFAKAVRYLKFKWEFVIIGRGCLVVLKFKSSLCWQMLCFKALKRLCSFGIKFPCVNPTFLRADSQWIIILKTFELVTANSMLNVIDSLPMLYVSLISTWDCYAVFEAWCD